MTMHYVKMCEDFQKKLERESVETKNWRERILHHAAPNELCCWPISAECLFCKHVQHFNLEM